MKKVLLIFLPLAAVASGVAVFFTVRKARGKAKI